MIIAAYFLAFWVILPFLLILGSRFADQLFFTGRSLPAFCLYAGLMIFIPGFLLMLAAVWQFRKFGQELPVSALPPERIIQKGFFAVWRHPIYLFAVITFFGLAMAMRSYGFVFILLPVFIFCVILYIRHEETILLKRFGPAYSTYRDRTYLLVPPLQIWLKMILSPLFRILFGIRVYQKGNIPESPPFFIVSSHRNYLDPFFISYALPWPVSNVSTFEMFRGSLKRRIFTALGSIPRKRYATGIKHILGIKRALYQGYPVGIFPEGERSWTGMMQPFKPEVLRMFKLFIQIPILPVRIEGNYHLWPRWSPRLLKGSIRLYFEPLIRIGEGDNPEELGRTIAEKVRPRGSAGTDDRCRSKNLTGKLSRLIYRCPACRTLEALREIPPRALRCDHCGHTIEIDSGFRLKHTLGENEMTVSIVDLYEEIRIKPADLDRPPAGKGQPQNNLPASLAGQTIIYAAGGTFFCEQEDTLVPLGNGIIYLTGSGVYFPDAGHGISLPFNQIGAATIESYCKLQLYLPSGEKLYQVILDQESIIKWQDTIVLIMERSGFKQPVIR